MVELSASAKRSLDEHIDNLDNDPRIPPFLFGVTTSEGDLYLKGSGTRTVGDHTSGEVDGDTAFWVCSEGKPIVHIAALQLVERGQLSLDTPVSDFFPEFKSCIIVSERSAPSVQASDVDSEAPYLVVTYRPAQNVMTVKHLMHHTSGLFYSGDSPQDWDNDLSNPYSLPQRAGDPVGDFFRWIKGDLPGIPLKFEPGTDWAYGWSSDVLGFVVEKASGMNLEAYLQENIFESLSMTRTSFYRTPRIAENHASISYRREGSDAFEPWTHRFYETEPSKGEYSLAIHASTVASQKAIVTRETLLKFLQPSLDERSRGNIQAFLQSSIPQSDTPSVQWANGQAVTTVDWEGRRKSGSGFWMGFLNLMYWIDPTTGVAAVLQAQYLPPLDGTLGLICEELERRLYVGLQDDSDEGAVEEGI